MSFFSDASPVVKGAIVVGAVGILYFAAAWMGGFAPFGSPAGETSQQRGLETQ